MGALESLSAQSSGIRHSARSANHLNAIATEVVKDAIALSEKADRLFLEWEQRHRPTEPILANIEKCVELFIQSQQIRFPPDLFEELDEYYYPDDRKSAARCGSVIFEIEPTEMADAIELEIPETLEDAIALTHSEDIDAWIEIVRTTATQRMSLSILIQNSGLSVVQVWIALLFGNFSIEREGDFYEGSIMIQNLEYDRAS